MNTAGKIALFTAALAAAFSGTYGVGAAIDPISAPEASNHGAHEEHGSKAADGGGEEPPGGLASAERGYRLDLRTPRLTAGEREKLRFVVRDEKGDALTSYQKEHTKELHLILASRDLATYRHLHPKRDHSGQWSISTELPRGGDYRLFADFVPRGAAGGQGLTLGTDLAVSGKYEPKALPRPARTATVDGYRVALEGELKPGSAQELRLKVSRDGKSVTDLQPYLGAYGHLVALRAGDLGYVHVHPNGEPGDGKTKAGPGISFTTTVPTEGSYRLFLDFKHEGKVRTAAFTVRAGAAEGGEDEEGGGAPDSPSTDHKH
ncbi:hypothetical protein ITI46_05295 [Streptomyces oryzae]|uniref:Heavy metal-binding domain-containing protein n=1 Tax=Streptomyces oryzae TaxID=1434886 RepID=A0ABS3X6W9_9ACTN|nr:hypothetical protein [Streptomyces oryzae]MBO8191110.1 hypothetical protein [Streptomyces oryzae]